MEESVFEQVMSVMKKEWVDEAFKTWISRRMWVILKEYPEFCEMFAQDEKHILDVAGAVPVTLESRPLLRKIAKTIASLDPSDCHHIRVASFKDRLCRAGMPGIAKIMSDKLG
jgi:hypothetical protein